MNMPITFTQNDNDYVDDFAPQAIVDFLTTALAGSTAQYAHAWYGEVSSDSPLLSLGCFPGGGVFISYNDHGAIWIYVDSEDYATTYRIQWGQDRVIIPRAYLMPIAMAETIVRYFGDSGRIPESSNWRDWASLPWDLYEE